MENTTSGTAVFSSALVLHQSGELLLNIPFPLQPISSPTMYTIFPRVHVIQHRKQRHAIELTQVITTVIYPYRPLLVIQLYKVKARLFEYSHKTHTHIFFMCLSYGNLIHCLPYCQSCSTSVVVMCWNRPAHGQDMVLHDRNSWCCAHLSRNAERLFWHYPSSWYCYWWTKMGQQLDVMIALPWEM